MTMLTEKETASLTRSEKLLTSALRSIVNTIGPNHQTVAELACKRIAEKTLLVFEGMIIITGDNSHD